MRALAGFLGESVAPCWCVVSRRASGQRARLLGFSAAADRRPTPPALLPPPAVDTPDGCFVARVPTQ